MWRIAYVWALALMFFIEGFAIEGFAIKLRESEDLKKYPAASRPPRVEGYCSGKGDIDEEAWSKVWVPGFYYMGVIYAENIGKNRDAACTALVRKAQEVGAQIMEVGTGSSRKDMTFWIPRGSRLYMKTETRYDDYLRAALWVYDPDREKREAQDSIVRGLKFIEDEGLRKITGQELQLRWEKDLMELKAAIQKGRYSEAKEKAAKMDKDWSTNLGCGDIGILRNNLGAVSVLISIPKRDAEQALKEFDEKCDKWRKEKSLVKQEEKRILMEKLSKLEDSLRAQQTNAKAWGDHMWGDLMGFVILMKSDLEKDDKYKAAEHALYCQQYQYCWNYNEKKTTKGCANRREVIDPFFDACTYYFQNEKDLFRH